MSACFGVIFVFCEFYRMRSSTVKMLYRLSDFRQMNICIYEGKVKPQSKTLKNKAEKLKLTPKLKDLKTSQKI